MDADAQQSSTTWLEDLNLQGKTINDPDDLFEHLPQLKAD